MTSIEATWTHEDESCAYGPSPPAGMTVAERGTWLTVALRGIPHYVALTRALGDIRERMAVDGQG